MFGVVCMLKVNKNKCLKLLLTVVKIVLFLPSENGELNGTPVNGHAAESEYCGGNVGSVCGQ